MASCTTLDASLVQTGQIPKTAITMPDLLSRKGGWAKRMPVLINRERSLLVVRLLFNAMERVFAFHFRPAED